MYTIEFKNLPKREGKTTEYEDYNYDNTIYYIFFLIPISDLSYWFLDGSVVQNRTGGR